MTRMATTGTPAAPAEMLGLLAQVTSTHGPEDLASRLVRLRSWVEQDLAEVDAALSSYDAGPTPMHKCAHHLLAFAGKRLRPMCVALTSRMGSGFGPAARELAVAAEMVHSATLLHDDVVDLGERRRGVDAARMVYGNAASIFAGDWLLVDAISRICRTAMGDVLDRALAVLREMLEAEGLQLASRGTFVSDAAVYFRVVEGKTASLFGWAMFAGARAGGLVHSECAMLETFGRNIGVAFQIVDDVLDVSGDPAVVGKSLFSDLREGKMTYPLLLAMDRDPGLAAVLREACASSDAVLEPALLRRTAATLRETGAIADATALAMRRCSEAMALMSTLPASPARDALEGVAMAMVHRNR